MIGCLAHSSTCGRLAMAADFVRTNDIDGVVVIGGGSSVGLGKVIGLDTSIPLIALPTTHAGSEMTQEWGLTRGNDKSTGCVPRVLPRTVIYDPELSVTLPVMLSAGGASAHLRHPSGGGRTVQHCRSIGAPLRRLAVARLSCATTMSLHHKLCHVIGGTFDLPHASVHATVLPYVLAYNLPAAPLRELGMPADGIQTVVDKATRNKYANPRPVTSASGPFVVSVRARLHVRRRESEAVAGDAAHYWSAGLLRCMPENVEQTCSRRSISEERNPTTTRFPGRSFPRVLICAAYRAMLSQRGPADRHIKGRTRCHSLPRRLQQRHHHLTSERIRSAFQGSVAGLSRHRLQI